MPRAHRHHLPGLVWHLTHRCHRRDFLLKFARDRTRYLHWVYEARRRYGLCLLDYMVTSNHVHLLVKDTGPSAISRSMQLIAGRTAQEYNLRKSRVGAFWEDRYHATAIERDTHLHRCISYIDLNMVRAGIVERPDHWAHSGYREIQNPPERFRLLDLPALAGLCGFRAVSELQRAHHAWIEDALRAAAPSRDGSWTDALAVGSEPFVTRVRSDLGMAARYRNVVAPGNDWILRDASEPYDRGFRVKNVLQAPPDPRI